MNHFSVDIETDGPCPGLYSIVSIGVVKVTNNLNTTFYAELAPISDNYIPEALAVSNTTREQHLTFNKPHLEIKRLSQFVKNKSFSSSRR